MQITDYRAFPTRLASIVVSMVVILVLSLIGITYAMKEQLHRNLSSDFPLIERHAVNVRLLQTMHLRLTSLTESYSEDLMETYLIERESFQFNFNQWLKLVNKEEDEFIVTSYLNSMILEDEIIKLLKEKKLKKAKKILRSKEYEEKRWEIFNFISNHVEAQTVKRDEQLKSISTIASAFFFATILVLVALVVLFLKLRTSYRKNLKAQRKLEVKVESERVKSLQTSRLSSLGEMAAGIAHEINNPLAIINANVYQFKKLVAKDKLEPERATEILESISKTVLRISDIIRGLKTFSREGSRDEFKSIAIRDIFNETLTFCEKKLEKRGIRIDLQEENLDIKIYCQYVQVCQVLLNLFVNARDALEELPEKWIQIKVLDLDDLVRIEFTDSGNGISKEIENKIFDPFFTTKDPNKGIGLGLSLSQKIIRDHEGDFFINRNSPNTQFVIVLPKGEMEEDESPTVQKAS